MNKHKLFLMPAVLLLTVVMRTTFGAEIKTPANVKPSGDAQGAVSNSVSPADLSGRLARIKLFINAMQTAENLMGERLFSVQGTYGSYCRTKLQEIATKSSDPQKTRTAEEVEVFENELERLETELIITSVNILPITQSSVRYNGKNSAEYYRMRNEELMRETKNMLAEWKQNAEKLKQKGTAIDLSIEIERVQAGMRKAFEINFPDRLFEQRLSLYRAVVNERLRAAGLTPDK